MKRSSMEVLPYNTYLLTNNILMKEYTKLILSNLILCKFMKKLFLFINCLILIVSGCSDEDILESHSIQPIQSAITRAGGDGVYDVLGMSYDATTSYLSDVAVKLPVIDFTKIDKNRIIISTASGSNSGYYYGANSEDYVKDIVKKTNISLGVNSIADSAKSSLFGGTLSGNKNLTSKYSYSSQYSFASHDEVFRIKFLRLNADIALLKQCLTQTFLEDLENYQPDKFIEAYGTHILCDVSIGGRLNMIYRSLVYTETSTTTKTRIVKSGFNAMIPKILKFNASSDSEVTVTEDDTKKNEDWSLFVQSFGGMAINNTYTPSGGVSAIDLGVWQNSISERNAALVDIAWDKTIPIYELVENPQKKEQIKKAMAEYINKKKIEMLPIATVFQSFDGDDHFYATEYKPTYGDKGQWKYEYPAFAIYSKQILGTIPFYQYWNGKDHLYTFDYYPQGIGNWKLEYILGYVYHNATEGAVPLYQAWNKTSSNHFYTTTYNPTYGGGLWKYEYIVCYLPPLIV